MSEINLIDFIKDLSWSEANDFNPIITIYNLRDRSVKKPNIEIIKESISIKSINYARLENETNNCPFIVDTYDLYLKKVVDFDYEKVIREILGTTIQQKYLLCWCMFEGGLINMRNLFLDWEIKSTYAICLPNEKTQLAFSDIERNSGNWKNLFKRINHYLFSLYPTCFISDEQRLK